MISRGRDGTPAGQARGLAETADQDRRPAGRRPAGGAGVPSPAPPS